MRFLTPLVPFSFFFSICNFPLKEWKKIEEKAIGCYQGAVIYGVPEVLEQGKGESTAIIYGNISFSPVFHSIFAVNSWTDNIFNIKSWCKKQAFNGRECLGQEFRDPSRYGLATCSISHARSSCHVRNIHSSFFIRFSCYSFPPRQ